MRGNKTENLQEDYLPPRGSPRGPPKTSNRFPFGKTRRKKDAQKWSEYFWVGDSAKFLKSGKSTLWTDAGVDQNFPRDLGAIGPYGFQTKFVWTNGPFPTLALFRNLSRKGFCRNPRGISPNKVLGEFCGGFLGGFFQAFFFGKKRRKNPQKNPRQNSNRNLGVSRPKSTLQGSGLSGVFEPIFGKAMRRSTFQ